MQLGLIINPIAGMGGKVGLKGTDGKETLEKAIQKGAQPKAQNRARQALESLGNTDATWLTFSGAMGEDTLKQLGYSHRVIGTPGNPTSANDTRKAAAQMAELGVDLLLFVGGDGTAVDIIETIDMKIPVLGVPSGVKMYSGVFAATPLKAGQIARDYLRGETSLAEREVMDIDEESYRMGRLDAELKGFARTPYKARLLLSEKHTAGGIDEDIMKEGLAESIVDEMKKDALYILGPGTTVAAISKILGQEKTILGVDLVRNGVNVATDVDEATILANLGEENYIIVSPLGGQGSIIGRGNQQISSQVIHRVGVDHLTVISTPVKLQELKTLAVDTGDPELDEELRGYRRVVMSRHEAKLMKVV